MHLFELKYYSELRRRLARGTMQPLFRDSDARLALTPGHLSVPEIHRILVCRPNHRLGNLLLLTPLVIELERLFPDAAVDIVLAGDHVAELFRAFPNVRHVYNLSRRMVRHPVAMARTLVQLRRAHYELAIDPCEASTSGRLLVAAAGARYVIGVPRSGATAPPIRMQHAPTHMAQWPVYLLREAMTRPSEDHDPAFPALDIRLSVDEQRRARATLDRLLDAADARRPGSIVGVFAEATGAKSYDRDWWQRLIDAIRARHAHVAIVEIAPPDGRARLGTIPFFSSPSPREVAAAIANMTCFVSADCGVMHLACASGTPTLGLFSVTDPAKYAPYGHGSRGLVTHGKTPEEVADAIDPMIGVSIAQAPGALP